MSFPGLPNRGLSGGGDGAATAGMSEQEQVMVKTVSDRVCNKPTGRNLTRFNTDASSHGELSC